MTFGYHNHGPEFGSEGGVVFYDELLRLTDPKLVIFEMDCGWVFAAGRNPVDYLSKTPERFPLLHVKDMAAAQRQYALGGPGPRRNGLQTPFFAPPPASSTTSSSRKSST
jgi:sugar phosphate isomerase/epimerase